MNITKYGKLQNRNAFRVHFVLFVEIFLSKKYKILKTIVVYMYDIYKFTVIKKSGNEEEQKIYRISFLLQVNYSISPLEIVKSLSYFLLLHLNWNLTIEGGVNNNNLLIAKGKSVSPSKQMSKIFLSCEFISPLNRNRQEFSVENVLHCGYITKTLNPMVKHLHRE